MNNPFQKKSRDDQFSDRDRDRLNSFIYARYGIKMPSANKSLITAWLQSRTNSLGIASIREYIDLILDPDSGSDELTNLIDVVTITESRFFSEPSHFEYLAREVLPGLVQTKGAGVRRPLMLWSAGCSSGEEPYTLTMVLSEFAELVPGINFKAKILATDISTNALAKATQAVYGMEQVEKIPLPVKKKYLLKSRDANRNLVRIVPNLRSMVRFRRLNLMDDQFGLREGLDVIFCRDVILYFDHRTQEKLIKKFCRHLNPGGFLFLGNSESLNDLSTPLVKIAPTIYRMPE
jgi:chemotaxis protein methyltransferase CheR